jgi:phthalate 4,5-cis-dihydrodiol dehydrogenase
MFGIGIIGAGSFGETHAKAIAELSNAKLVAAARTNTAALERFTQQFGGRGYRDYQELLNDPAVNVVVIAAPHHLHCEMAERAAQAGKHILLEKPMATNLVECDRILHAVKQAKVALTMGFTSHFVRSYQIAKQMIDSGEIGEIVLGISTMSKVWLDPNRRAWHLDRATGGGMWLTSGIHPLERLTWLIGSPVVQVYAQLATRFHDQPADDIGIVTLKYANGAMGTIVSTGYRIGATKHLTELTCTKGMLNIDYVDGIVIGRDEKWRIVPNSASSNWMHEALVAEWRAFLAALESSTAMPVTGEFGRAMMRVAFAAEESAQSDAAIQIA